MRERITRLSQKQSFRIPPFGGPAVQAEAVRRGGGGGAPGPPLSGDAAECSRRDSNSTAALEPASGTKIRR